MDTHRQLKYVNAVWCAVPPVGWAIAGNAYWYNSTTEESAWAAEEAHATAPTDGDLWAPEPESGSSASASDDEESDDDDDDDESEEESDDDDDSDESEDEDESEDGSGESSESSDFEEDGLEAKFQV